MQPQMLCVLEKRSIRFIGTWVGIVLELFLNDGHSTWWRLLEQGKIHIGWFQSFCTSWWEHLSPLWQKHDAQNYRYSLLMKETHNISCTYHVSQNVVEELFPLYIHSMMSKSIISHKYESYRIGGACRLLFGHRHSIFQDHQEWATVPAVWFWHTVNRAKISRGASLNFTHPRPWLSPPSCLRSYRIMLQHSKLN